MTIPLMVSKPCLQQRIRFYVAKDRDANYSPGRRSVQLYGRDASDYWNLDDTVYLPFHHAN